jgi:hypothetical protein|tara:strand:+ start:4075 stop:4413 length:339 start_codon:yes stop_codon:yes gene_type:complete
MTVLSTAKEHFKEIANQGQAHLDVPEWGTVVYWNVSGLNFAQQSKVIELQQKGKSAEALVEMMIMRALDGEGKKMFKLVEKTEIMREVDPNVILKIVTAMGDSELEEDPVKS